MVLLSVLYYNFVVTGGASHTVCKFKNRVFIGHSQRSLNSIGDNLAESI